MDEGGKGRLLVDYTNLQVPLNPFCSHAKKANTFDFCRQVFPCFNFSLRLMHLGVEVCTDNKCRRWVSRRRWKRVEGFCGISTTSTRDARVSRDFRIWPVFARFKWCRCERPLWNFVGLTPQAVPRIFCQVFFKVL